MILAAVNVANRSLSGVAEFLPRLAGAIVLLVVGLVVARLVARAVERLLRAAGADGLGERWGVHDVLERAGLPRSLSRLGRVVTRVGLSIVVVFAALSLLGLQFLSQSLNQGVLLLPKLLLAAALVLAGVVLAGLARERADRVAYQLDFPVPLGQLAQITILAVFVVMAAMQIAVSTTVLLLLLAIVLGAAATTMSLAFGLGGRDLARALSAGRYVRGAFAVGQSIAVADVHGTITAIESAATVVSTPDGREVRLPNHLLLESIVTIDDPGTGAD